jgi:hypothetical protein
MNRNQELWWEQCRSDYEVLVLLRQDGAAPCHQLHYLQMVTEKLAKAYFWRSGVPPPRSHAGAVQFMRSLAGVQQRNRAQLAATLGLANFKSLQSWIRNVLPMVYTLERLAPALAVDGPNPEYPWPHDGPTYSPVAYEFALWKQITETALGRQLVRVVGLAVARFPTLG